jgi:hypothetical protein
VSGYRNGKLPAPESEALAAALAELLLGLGFRAMAAQAGAERDHERLQLYARIVVKNAREPQKAAIRERLERLGLL